MKSKSFLSFFLVLAMLLGNVPLVFAEEVESTEVVSAEEVADSVYDITEDVDIIEGSEETEEKEVAKEEDGEQTTPPEVVESEPIIEVREPLLFEIAVPLNLSFSAEGRALTAADSIDNLTGLDLRFKGLCVTPCNDWFLEGAEVDFANYKANQKGFRFFFNGEVIETTDSIVNPFDSVELLDGESFDFSIAIELGPWDESFTEGIFTLTLYFEEVIKEEPIETLPPVPTETIPPVSTETPTVEPTETPNQPSPVESSEPTEGIEEPTDPPKEEPKDESIEKPTEEPSETEEPKEEPVEEPKEEPVEEPTDEPIEEPIEEPTEEEKDSEGIEEPESDAEPKEELPAPSEDSSEEVPKSEEGFLEEPQEKFEVDKKLEEIEGIEEKADIVVEEVSSAESILAPTDLTEFS